MQNPFSFLRRIGRYEAVSFLVLLGIAMPLKYLAGQPEAVKIVGWAHGVLFIAYCWALFRVWRAAKWGLGRPAVMFIAALLPFGPFLAERRLDAWEAEWRGAGAKN